MERLMRLSPGIQSMYKLCGVPNAMRRYGNRERYSVHDSIIAYKPTEITLLKRLLGQ
jgi:hypothetical protein